MREVARPNATPSIMDTLNDSRKIPIAWKIDERNTSVPWNWLKVLEDGLVSEIQERMEMVHSLIHNDTHSIVKQALAENDGIKLWINLILVENRQNGDRICGRQSGTKN